MRRRVRHAFGTVTTTGLVLERIKIPAFHQYGNGAKSGTRTIPERKLCGAETMPRTTR